MSRRTSSGAPTMCPTPSEGAYPSAASHPIPGQARGGGLRGVFLGGSTGGGVTPEGQG